MGRGSVMKKSPIYFIFLYYLKLKTALLTSVSCKYLMCKWRRSILWVHDNTLCQWPLDPLLTLSCVPWVCGEEWDGACPCEVASSRLHSYWLPTVFRSWWGSKEEEEARVFLLLPPPPPPQHLQVLHGFRPYRTGFILSPPLISFLLCSCSKAQCQGVLGASCYF